jgi:uncharacterized Zn-binding protein involved in type VI secretion
MPPAARLTDNHACTIEGDSPIVAPCCPTVMIGDMPAARVTDETFCGLPIAKGSSSVFIGNMPAARIGDTVACGGAIISGCTSVMIGG